MDIGNMLFINQVVLDSLEPMDTGIVLNNKLLIMFDHIHLLLISSISKYISSLLEKIINKVMKVNSSIYINTKLTLLLVLFIVSISNFELDQDSSNLSPSQS